MKKQLLLFLFTSVIICASCRKTTTLTQAEATASELQNAIKANQVNRVVVVINDQFPNYFNSDAGIKYSFSNGFVTISGYADVFNLTYLVSYDVSNVSISDNGSTFTTSKALILNFKF